jgi:mono/diheme cytochrome c family protein
MKTLFPLFALLLVATLAPAAEIDFEKKIRPLFRERCVGCHGPTKQKGGLRLDAKALAFKGGNHGPVIVPKESPKSELIRRIRSEDTSERMPPGDVALSAEQIGLLQQWIDSGADWPETEVDRIAAKDKRFDHWAWQPLTKPMPPPSRDSAHRNAIDQFIDAKLQANGLSLAPEADRRTLFRRLSFDLHGLPPDPERVRLFVESTDPFAFEKLLDEMLASPHYGERAARHWLDLAHYADTHGFERDQRRDHAYRYRDWVIAAFNRDLTYESFLLEQLAGDALRPNDPQAIIATSFLAAGPWDFVGQAETPSPVLKRLARADDLDDMITQVLTATCGLTINCARCHDHKLDPISQREYYQLWSVFAGVKRGNRPLNAEEEKRYTEQRNRLLAEQKELKALLGKKETPPEEVEKRKQRQEEIERELASLSEPPRVYGILSETPPEVKLLARGNPEEPKETVTPGTVSLVKLLSPALGTNSLSDPERRLALAKWITSLDNPLTRRVIVNRLWQSHFGTGLVETPSDFGLGGGIPSHPELLDWLAHQLQQKGGSLKELHRLICSSRTYRQSSIIPNPQANRIDQGNRLLWRQNPRRLEAESLRDSVLRSSGKLNLAMGGPGYRDFDYKEEYAPVYTYITADRPELWRRSIYRFVVRTTPQPFLTTLDCPNPANLSPTRNVTTTALQSLTLLNHEFMLKQSAYFAERIEREVGNSPPNQANLAFEIAFGRSPTKSESEAATLLIQKHGLRHLTRALLNANEFVVID